EPADEPAEAGPDCVLAVLEERAGYRVVARELAENERDEEHADERQKSKPDVGRASGAETQHEQRVDADHRRQVRERDREVREEREDAIELWLVAQALKPRILARTDIHRRSRLAVHRSLPRRREPRSGDSLRFVTTLSMACQGRCPG